VNGTPRALNRILIFIFGILLLAVGVLMVLLAAVPAVGAWWASWAPAASLRAGDLFATTVFPGTRVSWLWALAMALLVVVILCMVWWMAHQGTGRQDLVAWSSPTAERGSSDEAPGRVAIAASAVDQAIRGALAPRKDLVGSSVAAVEFEGKIALRVRVVARQGADPRAIADDVERLIGAMDLVFGHSCPVLLHVASGTRSRFSRAERVR
jgi:hypothetical protein